MMRCKKQSLFYEVIFDEKWNIIPQMTKIDFLRTRQSRQLMIHYKKSNFLQLSLQKTVFGWPISANYLKTSLINKLNIYLE